MLLDSDRFLDGDREAWDALESFDRVLAQAPRIRSLEDRALSTILDFVSQGPAYVGVSWGKDSVCVAHLTLLADPKIPLASVVVEPSQNPDCARVRDKFLERWPSASYTEVRIESRERKVLVDGRLPDDYRFQGKSPFARGLAEITERHGPRYISGVRGQESAVRSLAMRRYGSATKNTCRPIGHWRHPDVFAFLHRHDLPIHPAYAMTMAGALDRGRVRVSFLDGVTGRGRGRREWEEAYYPDVLRYIGEWATKES